MKNSLLIGSLLAISSALIYAIQTALVKGLGGQVAIPMIVWIQSIVCFLLIIPVLTITSKKPISHSLKTRHRHIYFFRTLFSLGISYCLFYSVQSIPLVDAVLLANTAPLLIPFIAWLFMSQRINHRLWLPLLLGLVGVGFVLQPDQHIFNWAALIALGAAICMASSILLVRKTAQEDSSFTNLFYYFAFSLPLTSLLVIPFWQSLSLYQWGLLISVGGLFFIVQLTLTQALQYAGAQTVGSLYLFNIIFAAIISVIIWGNALTITMISGIILTILGAMLTIQQNKPLNLKKTQP